MAPVFVLSITLCDYSYNKNVRNDFCKFMQLTGKAQINH